MNRFTRVAVWLTCAGSLSMAVPAFAGELVMMRDLPPAAKATVEHEAKGGVITEIEKDEKKGKTFYEVEYSKDGVKREIKVSQTGAVIERHKD
jgi:hypothetical protein